MSNRYTVLTYDPEQEKFTPQIGLEPYAGLTLPELRQAIAKLNRMGYATTAEAELGRDDLGDSCVSVEVDEQRELFA